MPGDRRDVLDHALSSHIMQFTTQSFWFDLSDTDHLLSLSTPPSCLVQKLAVVSQVTLLTLVLYSPFHILSQSSPLKHKSCYFMLRVFSNPI